MRAIIAQTDACVSHASKPSASSFLLLLTPCAPHLILDKLPMNSIRTPDETSDLSRMTVLPASLYHSLCSSIRTRLMAQLTAGCTLFVTIHTKVFEGG